MFHKKTYSTSTSSAETTADLLRVHLRYSFFNGELDIVESYEINGELEKALTLFQDWVQRGRAKADSILPAGYCSAT